MKKLTLFMMALAAGTAVQTQALAMEHGHMAGHGFDIPGGHDRAHAQTMQECNRFAGTGAGLVGNGEKCRNLAVDRGEHRGLALFGQAQGFRGQRRAVNLAFLQQLCVSEEDFAISDLRDHTVAGDGGKTVDDQLVLPMGASPIGQGAGKKMLRSGLGSRHQVG